MKYPLQGQIEKFKYKLLLLSNGDKMNEYDVSKEKIKKQSKYYLKFLELQIPFLEREYRRELGEAIAEAYKAEVIEGYKPNKEIINQGYWALLGSVALRSQLNLMKHLLKKINQNESPEDLEEVVKESEVSTSDYRGVVEKYQKLIEKMKELYKKN